MTYYLKFSKQIQNRLSFFAKETGCKEDEIIQTAILKHLEDLEDIRDAKEVLKNPGKQWTLEEVEQGLDLEN